MITQILSRTRLVRRWAPLSRFAETFEQLVRGVDAKLQIAHEPLFGLPELLQPVRERLEVRCRSSSILLLHSGSPIASETGEKTPPLVTGG